MAFHNPGCKRANNARVGRSQLYHKLFAISSRRARRAGIFGRTCRMYGVPFFMVQMYIQQLAMMMIKNANYSASSSYLDALRTQSKQVGCQHGQIRFLQACKAGPYRPARSFRITCTGIPSSKGRIRPLLKNASRNAPFCRHGKIFGAIPPPRYKPPRLITFSARLPASAP